MSNYYAVIMAGGSGERFWPLSRLEQPKQLLPIIGDKPMLRQTLDRLLGIIPAENIFVITHQRQQAAVAEVCPELKRENIVGEPVGRNTAPTIALATILIRRLDPNAVFAVLPADHVIHDTLTFQTELQSALELAADTPALLTFGIKPTEASTGYGYIQKANQSASPETIVTHEVQRFVEKPDASTAASYLASGDYYWNAGMFIWSIAAIAQALAEHTPSLWQSMLGLEEGLNRGEPIDELLAGIFPQLEKISIDYAVMERASSVLVIESSFDWDDVGDWPAITRHYQSDDQKNVVRGDAIIESGSNNLVVSCSGHTIALLGVEDLVVINSGDATLVCPKSQTQNIKQLVESLADHPKGKKLLEQPAPSRLP